MTFEHVSVLLDEAIDALQVRPGGVYVDCTAGGGGHSAAIAQRLEGGRLIALDRDEVAVAAARERLAAFPCDWEVVHAPFSELAEALAERGLAPGDVDGILADLGVSSPQLDEAGRGFSFRSEGPLDMRMDRSRGMPASELLATLGHGEIAHILKVYGDEKQAGRIASAILRRREQAPLQTTTELAELVQATVGRGKGRIHPATRTFQALRIAVNEEDEQLTALLDEAIGWLKPGGVLAVITFHSGEDRPVKRRFVELARDCVCDPRQPVCTCSWQPLVSLPRSRGWTASPDEIDANPRARSARLRVAVRLPTPNQRLPDAHAR